MPPRIQSETAPTFQAKKNSAFRETGMFEFYAGNGTLKSPRLGNEFPDFIDGLADMDKAVCECRPSRFGPIRRLRVVAAVKTDSFDLNRDMLALP